MKMANNHIFKKKLKGANTPRWRHTCEHGRQAEPVGFPANSVRSGNQAQTTCSHYQHTSCPLQPAADQTGSTVNCVTAQLPK